MDAQAAKMLTKGLFTRKRKGKVQSDSSKRVKVGVSSSRVPTSTVATFEVIVSTKIALTTEVDTTSMGPVPSITFDPSSGDRVLELLIKKGMGEERKKKAIAKMSYKVYRAPLLPDLLKEQTLLNLDRRTYDPTEMDAQAAKMLTKGLFTRKRKGKAQNDGSKRAKVGVSSSRVSASTATASEVIASIEIVQTIEVDTASMGLVPSMPLGTFSRDWVSELPIKKGIGEERKKKAIAKTSCKICLSGPDGDDNERGKDPFDNLEIVQDLNDRFVMPELDHQMLIHIKRAYRQEVEAKKAQEDLRVEVCHLQEWVDKGKWVDIESL
ncbi:hypothetical protein COCNU_scaffold000894G000010 [Cocos nucifera]|nr:hypothetical protein [Cocos nucifera]